MDFLEEECSPEERCYVLSLITNNFTLLEDYLLSSVTSTLHVSSTRDYSPISSALSSPVLLPKSSEYSQSPVEFDVVIDKEIRSTVGIVRRSGIVKVRLLQLCEFLLETQSCLFSCYMISHKLNAVLMV